MDETLDSNEDDTAIAKRHDDALYRTLSTPPNTNPAKVLADHVVVMEHGGCEVHYTRIVRLSHGDAKGVIGKMGSYMEIIP